MFLKLLLKTHVAHDKKTSKKQKRHQKFWKQVSYLVDDRRFKGQNREKWSWQVKKSEEKEKRCSKEEVDWFSMWSNIETVVEEHVSSENA